jgi:hypothetical protein
MKQSLGGTREYSSAGARLHSSAQLFDTNCIDRHNFATRQQAVTASTASPYGNEAARSRIARKPELPKPWAPAGAF